MDGESHFGNVHRCQSLGISMEMRSRDASDLEKYYRTVQKILRFPGTSQACEFQFSRDFANWDRMQGEIYYAMDEQNLYDNLVVSVGCFKFYSSSVNLSGNTMDGLFCYSSFLLLDGK